jgi:phosphatidylglycerophosphate synthase
MTGWALQRQGAPAIGLIAQLLLLGVLASTAGLGTPGWVVGVGCAVTMAALLARALARRPREWLGAASWITLGRATLAVGVAALVVDSFARPVPVALLVTLAAVALAADLVDGWVARRTGSATELGARLDGEVDAFLLLVLSLYVARPFGAWVLLIGAARYLFLAGERNLPWLRAPLPPRRWRKIVTAVQGVVLAVAAAGVLAHGLVKVALLVALVALAASFGECVWWLWRHRHEAPVLVEVERGPVRRGVAVAVTVLAVVVVWFALAAPDRPSDLTLAAFVRLPLELLVLAALGVVLPAAPRRVLAVVVGTVLAALVVVRVLDMGFFTLFDRPFLPVDDSSQWKNGIETMRDSIGRSTADLVVDFVVVFVVALIAASVWGLLRVTRAAADHRRRALQAIALLGVAWVGLRAVDTPVATTSASALAVREVRQVHSGLNAPKTLARQIARDRFAATPGDQLLTGLRGKNVLLVFVESYGQVAVQGSSFSPGVDRVLATGGAQLRAAGFSARSGWLTSPTFGGISWLAHSTFHTGVRIDTQRHYDQLIKTNRFTLSQAFERAGWRGVDVVPSNNRDWKPGTTFYHWDKIYDSRTLGYRGPRFGYPTMPDQYTYLALQRGELAKRHSRPIFAEVDTLSSHFPWTKIPRFIPWNKVGDGSVFNDIPPAESASQGALLRHGNQARRAFGKSIEYSLRTLFSYLQRYADKDTVLIMLGDHQPHTVISGQGATHDVPISIIARDPKVTRQLAGWHWTDGVRPSPQAPVWPMQAFRDRFLTAFGSTPATH